MPKPPEPPAPDASEAPLPGEATLPLRPTESTAVLAPTPDPDRPPPLHGALGTLEARVRALGLGFPRQEDLLTDVRILACELEKSRPDPERVAEVGRELVQADLGLLWPLVAALLEVRAIDAAVRREFQEAPTRRLPPDATAEQPKVGAKRPKATAGAKRTKKKKSARRS